MAEKTDEFKVLCIWCDAEWTAEMLLDLDYSEGCDTCGHGGGVHGVIEIRCSNCQKTVYVKEVNDR